MYVSSIPLLRTLRPCLAVAISFAAAASASAQFYQVLKSANYLQTGPGTPIPIPQRTFEFHATTPVALTSPRLTLPTGRTEALFKGEDDYEFHHYVATKAALDAAFPAGNYTVTSAGGPAVTLTFGADLYPTTIPQITNGTWNAGGMLVLDPTRANTITINTFAGYATAGVGGYSGIDADTDRDGAGINAFTPSLSAFGNGVPVSATPVTSLVIPAGAMTSGRVYGINVDFSTLQTFTTSTAAPNGIFAVYGNSTKVYVAALAPGAAAVPAPVIARQPADVTARVGTTATFTVSPTFNGSINFPAPGSVFADWHFNGNVIDQSAARYAGSNGVQLIIRNVTAADAGEYSYIIVTTGGVAMSNVVRLTVVTPPVIDLQPSSRTVVSDTTTVFSVGASGVPEPTYQWRKDNVAITGATSAMLVLPNAGSAQAGSYSCVVTNANGTVTSNAATLTISTSADFGRIVNLSILAGLAAGERNFTVGTVIGGARTTGTKPLLVRAAGPTLGAAPFNIGGVLPDPKLDFYSGSTVVASNDNWAGATALSNAFTALGAFPYANAATKDAAIFNPTLAVGGYTIQISDAGTGTGTVIAELYDSTPAAGFTPSTPRLVNVSVLKKIPTGDILTAGFVIGGSTAKTLLIRVVGPTLGAAPFNISGVMADPKLDLYSGSTVIASNDNWGGDAQLATASTGVGAFALNGVASKDAVLLVTLPPGAYTAQASGLGTGGMAIIEVYEVP